MFKIKTKSIKIIYGYQTDFIHVLKSTKNIILCKILSIFLKMLNRTSERCYRKWKDCILEDAEKVATTV